MSTLQALRDGREVLLSTMDVFLNEPVIDWLETKGNRQATKAGEREIKFGSGLRGRETGGGRMLKTEARNQKIVVENVTLQSPKAYPPFMLHSVN